MTQTQTARKNGASFLSLNKHGNIKHPQFTSKFIKEICSVSVNNINFNTAAQAMTKIAYSERCRSLEYLVKCEDFTDFKECINIIDTYNDFDAALIVKKSFWYLMLTQFVNDDNPNNGRNLFDFEIGREYSPVFYVYYNGKYNNKIIVDTETIYNKENPDKAGTTLYWQEYTEAHFRENMAKFSNEIKADEFSIKTKYTYQTGENCLEARFWFD